MSPIREDVGRATRDISTDLPVGKMGSHMADLLEGKQSLLAHWEEQRLNRRARNISKLNKTNESHCRDVAKQQWDEVSNFVDGQIRCMITESNARDAKMTAKLVIKTDNMALLMRRITKRHYGLRTEDLIHLVSALMSCHFYVTAMQN
ncbi:hypothetical protein HPB50_028613 [Hyalomma asiaticum]|nr:hypothetical protein HPB50_028613 [Hyalomma asiaticum]